jgi:hypothetical protein
MALTIKEKVAAIRAQKAPSSIQSTTESPTNEQSPSIEQSSCTIQSESIQATSLQDAEVKEVLADNATRDEGLSLPASANGGDLVAVSNSDSFNELLGVLPAKNDSSVGEAKSFLSQRINLLCNIEDLDNLKTEMASLRVALLANPAACELLLPEEVGELVRHQRKLTNTELAAKKPKKAIVEKAKPVKVSKEEAAKMLVDLNFDSLF